MRQHYTKPRPWQPLSDAEWDALQPYLEERPGPGRPLVNPRRRMDAIFLVALAHVPWRRLPPQYGKADTIHRHFRRLAHAGFWELLLRACANPATAPALRSLEHWICRAYRRATRIIGTLRAIRIARDLGFLSALRAPPCVLPDPDLSECYRGIIAAVLDRYHDNWWEIPDGLLAALGRLLDFAAGWKRVPRRLEFA